MQWYRHTRLFGVAGFNALLTSGLRVLFYDAWRPLQSGVEHARLWNGQRLCYLELLQYRVRACFLAYFCLFVRHTKAARSHERSWCLHKRRTVARGFVTTRRCNALPAFCDVYSNAIASQHRLSEVVHFPVKKCALT